MSTLTEHTHVGCNKSDNTFSERRPSRGFNSPHGSVSKHHVSVDGWLFLSDDQSDSERDIPNIHQTADTSSKSDEGWTVVKPENQKPKSLADSTSYQNQSAFRSIGISQDAVTNCKEPKWRKHGSKSNKRHNSGPDWPSLPGPSFAEDNTSLQGSNTASTKGFSTNREHQVFKSELSTKKHFRKDFPFNSLAFVDNTDYDRQQSHNTCNLDPAELGSPKQDLFSADQESCFRQNVMSPELVASRIPVSSSQPLSNAFTGKGKINIENAQKSQWETLEQISPLQIHRTLDLVNATKNATLIAKAKSELPPDKDVSFQVGSSSRKDLPKGVFSLCEHFLQDNRTAKAFRPPKPCSNCTKHSNLLYGIWRSSKKEWQVMRPYPKDVNSHVPFKHCWHFSNGDRCHKNSCTFAHGEEELMFWTSRRQSGRL